MGADERAIGLGISTEAQPRGYLNRCARAGDLLFTSGHTSDAKGVLGADLTVEEGYAAARDCALKILRSVREVHGTLDGLRVVKVLGCVASAPGFVDQAPVVNGCSDVLHEVFGRDGDGWHARSALGFVGLPGGAAVEVEAVFQIL